MKSIISFVGVLLLVAAASFIFICSVGKSVPSSQDYSAEEALKVLRAIERVEGESQKPWTGSLRKIAVTESELNSYIAYRIETEREEIMRELQLRLFDKNRIEGKIRIDLRGKKIPQFIRPDLNFYFSADVLVSGGLVKIDVKEVFLEDEPIKLQLLDMVIAIAARLSGEEPTSLYDWYELPYGIKDIKTQKGKATFYY